MLSSSELVTIAITCYNAQTTIERAVRSAQEQTWSNLEIIIVDDASGDSSREILDQLALEDCRIRLIAHAKNAGVAEARNTLLQAASGMFIAFFDDDDWSHPDRVRRQVTRLKEYEVAHGVDLAVCYASRLQHLQSGAMRLVTPLGREGSAPCHGTAVADLILIGRPVTKGTSGRGECATCSLFARRAVIDDLGGYDPAFRRSEDTEFNLRLALAGGHFVGVEAPLVEQTITVCDHKTPERELEFVHLLLHKHKDVFPNQRWLAFMQTWAEARATLSAGKLVAGAAHLAWLAATKPDLVARKLAWLWRSQIESVIPLTGTRWEAT